MSLQAKIIEQLCLKEEFMHFMRREKLWKK